MSVALALLKRLANSRYEAMKRKDREIAELRAANEVLKELLKTARPFITDRINITYHDLRQDIDKALDMPEIDHGGSS